MDGAFFVCLGGDLCLEFFNSNTLLNSDRDDFKRSIEGLKCHVLLVADEIEELLKNKRMLEIFRLEGESKRLTNSILVSTRSSISHSSFRLTVAARCIKWSMIRMWKDEFRKFAYGVEAVADAFIRAANSLSAVADDPQTAADGTEAAAYGLATTSKSLGAVADDLKAAADGLNEATYGLYKEADNLKEAAYGLETAANAFESGIRDLQNRVIRFLIMDKVRKLSDEEARRDTFKSSRQLLKIKQGLPGFLNGSSISALADTGSRKNIISQSYAKSLNLQITKSPCDFQLGSSHRARSIGMHYTIMINDGGV